MLRKTTLFLLLFICSAFFQPSFREQQQAYPRVRQAYLEKESAMLNLLQEKGIAVNRLNLYIRAFKAERQMELWGKNGSDSTFRLLKVYRICNLSGVAGPKRKQGDLQVPEGFYHISIFNPDSRFYLSLAVNYPNRSDRILGDPVSPGGNICIHGSCVTIGCLPITDDQIRDLYIFCVEARNNGQEKIPVTIFPARMEGEDYARLYRAFSNDPDISGLWADLKKGFDIFNETKKLPVVSFLANGRHQVTADR